jgi:hypothetical protein
MIRPYPERKSFGQYEGARRSARASELGPASTCMEFGPGIAVAN